MNKIIAFVVLHYNTIEDTVECVESIRKHIPAANRRIVVVDNASPNGTGTTLRDWYGNDEDVTVLINKENEGFARGNNLGFMYAKRELKADYIAVINNDTLILQDDFLQIVDDAYAQYRFAVLGPVVETPDGDYSSNPGVERLKPIGSYWRYILVVAIEYAFSFVNMDVLYKSMKNTVKTKMVTEPYPSAKVNVQLHGCFWVFSPEYISRFDGINGRTFLYREEELLFHRLLTNGLKSVYVPQLRIFHKEGKTMQTVKKASAAKRRFQYKNYIKSTLVLINEMKNNSIKQHNPAQIAIVGGGINA